MANKNEARTGQQQGTQQGTQQGQSSREDTTGRQEQSGRMQEDTSSDRSFREGTSRGQ